jgi:hypothetical protein
MSKRTYVVRFKVKGRPKTFKVNARDPEEACRKMKSDGKIVSVVQVR